MLVCVFVTEIGPQPTFSEILPTPVIIHDVEMNGGVTQSLGTAGYSPVYEN